MATKRTRGARTPQSRITDRAVELYAEAAPLWPGRLACVQSDAMCTHDDCQTFNRLSSELSMELGIKPWMPDVFDVPDDDPPNPDDYAKHFPAVRALRDELRALAEERDNQSGGNTE